MSYRMSFTSAGLMVRESLILTQTFKSVQDWVQVKRQVFEQNLLQSTKPSSAKRNIRELSDRLKMLTDQQTELLLDGSHAEQLQMLWLATVKTYRFLHEFAEEVVREKFLRLDYQLGYGDFDGFFNSKAEWDDDLEGLSESTRKKVRQVVFRMLREAEILTGAGMIVPSLFSAEAARVIREDDPGLFRDFPVSDLDIQGYMQ